MPWKKPSVSHVVVTSHFMLDQLEQRRLLSGSPTAPTLTANAVSSTQIDLTWSTPDSSSGIHLELEEKAPLDQNFQVVGMPGGDLTDPDVHHLTGLSPGTAYSFKLRADENGLVDYSSGSATTPLADTPDADDNAPPKPQITEIDDSPGMESIAFTGNYGYLGYPYSVYVKSQRTDDPYGVLDKAANDGAQGSNGQYGVDVWGQTSGATYQLQLSVSADPSTGYTSVNYSEPFKYTDSDGSIPQALTLGSQDAGNGQVTFDWSGNSSDFNEVSLFAVNDGAIDPNWHPYSYTSQGSITTNAAPTGSKVFAVYQDSDGADSNYGWSGYSNFVDGSGTTPAQTPAAPAQFAGRAVFDGDVTKVSDNKVNLLWDNTPNNESGFDVQRSDDGGVTFTDVKSTAADVTHATDTGMKPGKYVYRVHSLGSNGADPSAWVTVTVNVWPPGVMASFDGTWGFRDHDQYLADHNGSQQAWGGEWGGTTAIPLFTDLYHVGNALNVNTKDYKRGVANAYDHSSVVNQDFLAADPLEAMGTVIAAWKQLGQHYHDLIGTDTAHASQIVSQFPVDLLGYSRGAVQAIKLAQLINDYGVPDPTTSYIATQQIPSGHGNITLSYTDYHVKFQPSIRFIGLLSPVFLMSPLDAALALTTFGIGQINFDWPTSVPAGVGHVVVIHDEDPDQLLRNETDVTRAGGSTAADYISPPQPYNHGDLGMHWATLKLLLDKANDDNVPVPFGDDITINYQSGQVTGWSFNELLA